MQLLIIVSAAFFLFLWLTTQFILRVTDATVHLLAVVALLLFIVWLWQRIRVDRY